MADYNKAPIVKWAVINETNSGDKEIVAAVAGKKISVHAMCLGVSANGTIRFESGAGGTALTGIMDVKTAASPNWHLAYSNVPWFQTAAGAALSIEAVITGDVDGFIVYSEE